MSAVVGYPVRHHDESWTTEPRATCLRCGSGAAVTSRGNLRPHGRCRSVASAAALPTFAWRTYGGYIDGKPVEFWARSS